MGRAIAPLFHTPHSEFALRNFLPTPHFEAHPAPSPACVRSHCPWLFRENDERYNHSAGNGANSFALSRPTSSFCSLASRRHSKLTDLFPALFFMHKERPPCDIILPLFLLTLGLAAFVVVSPPPKKKRKPPPPTRRCAARVAARSAASRYYICPLKCNAAGILPIYRMMQ